MKLTILGCYAATPRTFSNPTSQVLEIKNKYLLIDCGEGTQVQLRKQKIKFQRIEYIFISHLHGDHFYGLIGLITSFNLLGRTRDLHIYAPIGGQKIIDMTLELTGSKINYNLIFHQLSSDKSEHILDIPEMDVYTIPLEHRIYTNGFLFKEKPNPRKLNMAVIEQYNIPICYLQNIKNGNGHTTENGTVIDHEKLTLPAAPTKSYAYCSDTAYQEDIVPIIREVDLLYHESTFTQDKESLAEMTKHSTAQQAATIAKMAAVKRLILGHYSTRYSDITVFQDEAKPIFPNVDLARDGRVFEF